MTRHRIALAAAGLTAIAAAGIAFAAEPAPPQPAPGAMVDALHTAFGDHHVRAVHAKGVMAVGTFEPTAAAARLSKATLFSAGPRPLLARFSDFTGIPDIPDVAPEANPRGLALQFTLVDGSKANVVSHSFNGFPTATSAEFRELLLAIPVSGPTAAKPTALDRFLAGHPIAKTFLTTQKPAPQSYATLSYFGVNAFAFTGPDGARRFVRYRFIPLGGEALLSPADLAAKGPDYLQSELPQRLAKGPIAFEWYAQVAEAGDVIADPSVAWPEGRRLVKLGVIRLDRMAPDPVATDRATTFPPLAVPAGIEAADPMLGVRQGAYPISFAHRQ
ncbi:catalase family peroxidase [Phenylobacterium sp.]|uniref:catalase family peroxidase n=1 Tax=Phenylobacterium sp. TaxID=1871053 RepID=UPI00356A32FD